VLFIGASWHAQIWSEADHSVRTGRSATESAFGVPFFDYVQTQNPDAGAQFDAAMAAGSRLQAQLLVRRYDFSGVGSVCDVGGGTGTVLAEVLKANAAARGTLFDLPSVLAKVSHELDGAQSVAPLVPVRLDAPDERVALVAAQRARAEVAGDLGVGVERGERVAVLGPPPAESQPFSLQDEHAATVAAPCDEARRGVDCTR